jgi:hypothetical protein
VYKLVEPEAAIVVKMNGGLDPRRELPGRFAVTSRDFVELACRIPRVLPSVVRRHLKNRSLLFVAHGLGEPDLRELARYAHAQRGARPSWAAQLDKRTDEIEYWRDSRGVELVDADLDTYILKLSGTLRTRFGIDT